MHISKMINYVKNEIHFAQEFCEDNVFVTLRIEPILKIIENLEQSHQDILEITKENIKKDKIIDLMAEEINNSFLNTCPYIDYEIDLDCENRCNDDYKECWKQYFKRKAEKE